MQIVWDHENLFTFDFFELGFFGLTFYFVDHLLSFVKYSFIEMGSNSVFPAVSILGREVRSRTDFFKRMLTEFVGFH